jgi:RNA polymerase sigma-70 factor (ECF subfamily)
MRNTFFSDLRKLRREVEDVDGLCAQALAEPPRQVDAIALKELIAAIGQLPRAQRRPLVLMGAYGFSQLEAADACGCTIGTIKSRVSRGRATLSMMLDHYEIDNGSRPTRSSTLERAARSPLQNGGQVKSNAR